MDVTMPRKLPPSVERNHVKGHTYLSFRIGKGKRIRLPDDPTSEEFREAYARAMAGDTEAKPKPKEDAPGTSALADTGRVENNHGKNAAR
jgi:enterobacteria phage integrase